MNYEDTDKSVSEEEYNKLPSFVLVEVQVKDYEGYPKMEDATRTINPHQFYLNKNTYKKNNDGEWNQVTKMRKETLEVLGLEDSKLGTEQKDTSRPFVIGIVYSLQTTKIPVIQSEMMDDGFLQVKIVVDSTKDGKPLLNVSKEEEEKKNKKRVPEESKLQNESQEKKPKISKNESEDNQEHANESKGRCNFPLKKGGNCKNSINCHIKTHKKK
eukprot:TRINITY_DN8556_c0_g1_i1.p1 TRINITY_DN8556_c0_g1~~TRINITY_DN8556_c0_g1_i1.p1  ORF type:complete len:214 (-),score=42.92 TRINITY_DN8556_c0_g1_i1:38-679(-)